MAGSVMQESSQGTGQRRVVAPGGGKILAGLFLLVLSLDQVTKAAVLDLIQPGEVHPVIPGLFNLTLAFNKGVAFGMFADLGDGLRQVMLGITAAVALAAVGWFFVRDYAGDLIGQGALVMILGGAIGNIIDRVRLGMVVDFLDVYVNEWHWPAFNIADSAICIGVVVLLLRKPRTCA